MIASSYSIDFLLSSSNLLPDAADGRLRDRKSHVLPPTDLDSDTTRGNDAVAKVTVYRTALQWLDVIFERDVCDHEL